MNLVHICACARHVHCNWMRENVPCVENQLRALSMSFCEICNEEDLNEWDSISLLIPPHTLMSFHAVIVVSWPDYKRPGCDMTTKSFKTLSQMQSFVKKSVVTWLEDRDVEASTLKEFDEEFREGPWINVTIQDESLYPIGAFYFDSEGHHVIDMKPILQDTIPKWYKRRQLELED